MPVSRCVRQPAHQRSEQFFIEIRRCVILSFGHMIAKVAFLQCLPNELCVLCVCAIPLTEELIEYEQSD
eukprot:10247701-Alexandrium_andersonii.AAC.1